ncbi:MAG: ABC transporter ATP-binding protein [Tissierellales bacterium]|nr:ABC transporter ATP-binding protein [Tissierellales bacterium]
MKNEETILKVRNLEKSFVLDNGYFGIGKKYMKVIDDLSFELKKGEVLGLVGESGCGKSTTARLVLRLLEADGGAVYFKGEDILKLKSGELRKLRSKLQIVFQDPFSSLNPRMKVFDLIAEPLRHHQSLNRDEIKDRVLEVIETVGLQEHALYKYPHEFSGGQRQRIAIARALILKPDIIVCDEAVSALDVSIQNQILNLFKSIKKSMGITYLFISHDLSVVNYISDRVCVMYLGEIAEMGTSDDIFKSSKHPYTELLMKSILKPNPSLNQDLGEIEGEVPSYESNIAGCKFYGRCKYSKAICRDSKPKLDMYKDEHYVACHMYK